MTLVVRAPFPRRGDIIEIPRGNGWAPKTVTSIGTSDGVAAFWVAGIASKFTASQRERGWRWPKPSVVRGRKLWPQLQPPPAPAPSNFRQFVDAIHAGEPIYLVGPDGRVEEMPAATFELLPGVTIRDQHVFTDKAKARAYASQRARESR